MRRKRKPKDRPGRSASIGKRISLTDRKLVEAGVHRRAFLRMTIDVANTVVGLGALGVGVLDLYNTISDQAKREQEKLLANELSALSRLLGAGQSKSASLVAAANHPFKDPPDGLPCYPTEAGCVVKFKQRFLPVDVYVSEILDQPEHYSEIRYDDSVVLFGSQVANLKTRSILGNPFLEKPIHLVHGELNDWETKLWWNLHTPESAPETKRTQFGGEWITKNGTFVGSGVDSFTPKMEGESLAEDYLLTTVLPRFKRGPQRLVIFGAAHGPGSRAAALLLDKPPMKQLEQLGNKTDNAPYFQAMWHVKSFKDTRTGELLPAELTLCEAKRLHVPGVQFAT